MENMDGVAGGDEVDQLGDGIEGIDENVPLDLRDIVDIDMAFPPAADTRRLFQGMMGTNSLIQVPPYYNTFHSGALPDSPPDSGSEHLLSPGSTSHLSSSPQQQQPQQPPSQVMGVPLDLNNIDYSLPMQLLEAGAGHADGDHQLHVSVNPATILPSRGDTVYTMQEQQPQFQSDMQSQPRCSQSSPPGAISVVIKNEVMQQAGGGGTGGGGQESQQQPRAKRKRKENAPTGAGTEDIPSVPPFVKVNIGNQLTLFKYLESSYLHIYVLMYT